ncbi:MAG TPA: hypothetical protein VJW20_02950 [Candidatus Angelobacter sp.]|nr:hypothetical protein [Candidatus Angelobacter sp.]
MKTAIRVLVFAGMLIAISANAQNFVGKTGNFGEPIPVPIPPPQISQAVPQGMPIPVPIPPPISERV